MELPIPSRTYLPSDPIWLDVGLDIGNAYTVGAFKVSHETGRDLDSKFIAFDYHAAYYPAQRLRRSLGMPSCIHYMNGAASIGFQAWRRTSGDISDISDDGLMIPYFKLALDGHDQFAKERQELPGSIKPLPVGKILEEVLQDFLYELFKTWRNQLRDQVFPDHILLKLNCAIPTAWKTTEPLAKVSRAIIGAAVGAGLNIDPSIHFWTESLATTNYLIQHDSRLLDSLNVGQAFTVCDAGGGTCDVITFLVRSLEPIKLQEIVAAKGAVCGSECLDERFRLQLHERLDSWRKSNDTNEKMIEPALRGILLAFNRDVKREWSGDHFTYKYPIPGLIEDKEKSFGNGTILIERAHLKHVFDPVCSRVWGLLKEQIDTARESHLPVEMIILTGGFSGSPYLRRFLVERLARMGTLDPVSNVDLVVCKANDLTVAVGAIQCVETSSFTNERINHRSIGVIQTEHYDPDNVPGHMSAVPFVCHITGQLLVQDCVKFLMKRNEIQKDPAPCRFYQTFDSDDDQVIITIRLCSSDTNTDDSYQIAHEKNKDLNEWEEITFVCNISSFKEDLPIFNGYGLEHMVSTAHKNPQWVADIPSNRHESIELRPSFRTRKKTPQSIASGTKMRLYNEKRTNQAGFRNSNSSLPVETPLRRWRTVEFQFHLKIIGLLAHYTIECVSVPKDGLKFQGSVNIGWMFGPDISTERISQLDNVSLSTTSASNHPLSSINKSDPELSISCETIPTTISSSEERNKGKPPLLQRAPSEDLSNISDFSTTIPYEQQMEVVGIFALALCDHVNRQHNSLVVPSVSHARVKNILAQKIKRYARTVRKNTAGTLEHRPIRNFVKTVHLYRGNIAAKFANNILPAEVVEEIEENQSTDEENEEVQQPWADKIKAWHFDLDSNFPLDDVSHNDIEQADLNQISSDSESMSDDDNFIVGKRLDYKQLYEYLISQEDFKLLTSQVDGIVRHYCTDIMKIIRADILQNFQSAKVTFGIQIIVEWDMLGYLADQYGPDIKPDLRSLLTITGNRIDAQMTTVGSYFRQTWPLFSEILLSTLQEVAEGRNPGLACRQETFRNNEEYIIEACVSPNSVQVALQGPREFFVAIAQQLAWLGSACRLPEFDRDLSYCDALWCKEEQVDPVFHGQSFTIKYSVTDLDKDEPICCWTSIVARSMIATGFPIRERFSTDIGLEIPFEIMLALVGTSLAAFDEHGFVIRGRRVGLVPTQRIENHVQWHVVRNDENVVKLQDLWKIEPRLSLEQLDEDCLTSTVAFLGWTSSVINRAVTGEIDYSLIQLSNAQPKDTTNLHVSGFSVGFSQHFASSIHSQLVTIKRSPPVRQIEDYEEILEDLRSQIVILYDTKAKRGWSTNGEQSTLQILLHRVQVGYNGYISPNTNIQSARAFPSVSVRRAMQNNRDVELRSGFNMRDKVEEPLAFHRVVLNIWNQFQLFLDQSENLTNSAKTEISQLLRRHPWARPAIIGWEYIDVFSPQQRSCPKEVKLETTCGNWPKLLDGLNPLFLFAENFQDILVPTDPTSLCPLLRTVPKHKSFLAGELSVLRNFIRQNPLQPFEFVGSRTGTKCDTHMIAFCVDSSGSCPCSTAPKTTWQLVSSLFEDRRKNGAVVFGKRESNVIFRGKDHRNKVDGTQSDSGPRMDLISHNVPRPTELPCESTRMNFEMASSGSLATVEASP